jgi:hypothetical protein
MADALRAAPLCDLVVAYPTIHPRADLAWLERNAMWMPSTAVIAVGVRWCELLYDLIA